MLKNSLLVTLLGCIGLAGNAQAAPILLNWGANGGVDSVVAGGASITFSPIHVKSFDSISISGYWTNLVDTRFSSLRAEIRVRLEGNWLTVAYNDHVRGGYGSVSPFYAADFEIIPNDLSAGSVDGLMIAPDSVIFSGLGGLNSEGGTSFAFTAGSVPEPESYALVLCALGLMGAISRRSKTKPD